MCIKQLDSSLKVGCEAEFFQGFEEEIVGDYQKLWVDLLI